MTDIYAINVVEDEVGIDVLAEDEANVPSIAIPGPPGPMPELRVDDGVLQWRPVKLTPDAWTDLLDLGGYLTASEVARAAAEAARNLAEEYKVAAESAAVLVTNAVTLAEEYRDDAIAARNAAEESAGEAAADRAQTGLDRLATGADAIATAADRVATGQDKTATASDRIQTGLDRAATNADRIQTDLDKVATSTDRTQTGLDRLATAADAVATAQDRGATAADRIQTGLDKAATNADRVQTGLDRAAAEAAASSAATFNPANFQARSEKGTPDGYASLGSDGKVPSDQLPAITSTPARLGEVAQAIADWDFALANGWYMALDALNGPASGWWMGVVEVHNIDWVTQTVHGFATDTSADTQMFRRDRSGGTWSPWYRLRVSEAELDQRYLRSESYGDRGALGTVDLNTVRTAGVYGSLIENSTLARNYPVEGVPGALEVIVLDHNTEPFNIAAQRFTTNETTQRVFMRRGGRLGGWSAWVEMATGNARGQANGYAPLDGDGKVPLANLPAISSASSVVLQVFTSSGTFTKEADDIAYYVECVGGGGSGGRPTGASSAGTGGFPGDVSGDFLSASQVASSVSVIVGAGAPGTSTAGGNGNEGGASSFGSHVKAVGGLAGIGSFMNTMFLFYGAGGQGTVTAVASVALPQLKNSKNFSGRHDQDADSEVVHLPTHGLCNAGIGGLRLPPQSAGYGRGGTSLGAAGSAPGGGGAIFIGSGTSGAGARGEVRIWRFKK